MTRLPLITNSECTTFRRCNREHHIAYTLNVRPVAKDAPLRFGTGIHASLERGYDVGNFSALRDDYADEYEYQMADAMLAGYAARWVNDGLTALAVESQFSTPLINPATGHASTKYELGGKLDAIVRDERGDVWVLEHKTSSQDITPGSTYWARLRLDSQVSMYMVGARALGYEPRGVIYDVLGKPLQRPSDVACVDDDGIKIVRDRAGQRVRTKDGKKWRQTGDTESGYVLQTRPETPLEYGDRIRIIIAADPDAYYQRGTVVRLAEEEREAAADTWQIAARIRESRNTGIAPRNPDACVRYSRLCPYWAVCTGETSLDNPTRYVRVEQAHQELEAAQ